MGIILPGESITILTVTSLLLNTWLFTGSENCIARNRVVSKLCLARTFSKDCLTKSMKRISIFSRIKMSRMVSTRAIQKRNKLAISRKIKRPCITSKIGMFLFKEHQDYSQNRNFGPAKIVLYAV
jgi:hypothetical protein